MSVCLHIEEAGEEQANEDGEEEGGREHFGALLRPRVVVRRRRSDGDEKCLVEKEGEFMSRTGASRGEIISEIFVDIG